MPRSIQHPRATVRPLIEGLGALVVLVCGLVGIPVVLATTVGWPLPHHLRRGPGGERVLRAPSRFVLAPSLRGLGLDSLGLLRLLRPRQRSPVSALRRGIVVALSGATVRPPAWSLRSSRRPCVLSQLRGAPTGRIPAPTSVATAPFRSAVASPPSTSSVARPALQLVSDSTPLPAAQIAKVTHTVVAGDTLWGIAETYYGNGEQWQAIYQANVGALQPDGRALGNAHWIYPGWTLIIPSLTVAAPTPSPSPAPADPTPTPVAAPTTQPAATQSTVAQPAHAVTSHDDHTSTSPQSAKTPHVGKKANPAPRADHADATSPVPAVPGAPSTPHPMPPSASTRCPQARRGPSGCLWCRRNRAPGHRGGHLRPGGHRHRRRPRSPAPAPARRVPGPADPSPGAAQRRRRPRVGIRHYARADGAFWLTRLGDLLAYAADRAGVPRPKCSASTPSPRSRRLRRRRNRRSSRRHSSVVHGTESGTSRSAPIPVCSTKHRGRAGSPDALQHWSAAPVSPC